jgi:hypothetical protein
MVFPTLSSVKKLEYKSIPWDRDLRIQGVKLSIGQSIPSESHVLVVELGA